MVTEQGLLFWAQAAEAAGALKQPRPFTLTAAQALKTKLLFLMGRQAAQTRA
jgi:hypothetical protein